MIFWFQDIELLICQYRMQAMTDSGIMDRIYYNHKASSFILKKKQLKKIHLL